MLVKYVEKNKIKSFKISHLLKSEISETEKLEVQLGGSLKSKIPGFLNFFSKL